MEGNEISKGTDPELPRELLLIFLMKSVWNQYGNGPGAPQKSSAFFFVKVNRISKEMDQQLPRGLLLIFLIESV